MKHETETAPRDVYIIQCCTSMPSAYFENPPNNLLFTKNNMKWFLILTKLEERLWKVKILLIWLLDKKLINV